MLRRGGGRVDGSGVTQPVSLGGRQRHHDDEHQHHVDDRGAPDDRTLSGDRTASGDDGSTDGNGAVPRHNRTDAAAGSASALAQGRRHPLHAAPAPAATAAAAV